MAKEKREKEERPEEYTEVPDFPIGGNDIIDVTPKTLKNGNVDATKKRK